MMKISNDTILAYIDGKLSGDERIEIEQLIKADPDFKRRFDALNIVDSTIKLGKLQSPSSNFVSQVMKAILNPALEQDRFFNKTRYFVLGLIVVAFLGTIYFLAINFYPSLSGIVADQVTISNQTVDLKPANEFLSNDFIFKIVFYVNGIVCLLLFERAFLKPFFTRRKQRFSM